ncbi:hypothetical protein D9M71_782000 [compost metagenome]
MKRPSLASEDVLLGRPLPLSGRAIIWKQVSPCAGNVSMMRPPQRTGVPVCFCATESRGDTGLNCPCKGLGAVAQAASVSVAARVMRMRVFMVVLRVSGDACAGQPIMKRGRTERQRIAHR